MKNTLTTVINSFSVTTPNRHQRRVVSDIKGGLLTFRTYRWVILSVFVVALYYVFLASDRYQSKATLFIKSAEAETTSVPGLQLISGNISEQRDSSVLVSYIHSYSMLDYLDERIKINEHFSSSDWDFISRMAKEPSREDFLAYYRCRFLLSSAIDCSLIEVRAPGFTP